MICTAIELSITLFITRFSVPQIVSLLNKKILSGIEVQYTTFCLPKLEY